MPNEPPDQPDESPDPSAAGTDDQETLKPSHPVEWPFEGMDKPPKTIGQYRIIGVIGSGGMGAVYEAAQDNPRRRVALKVVKSDRATPAAMRRFQFEVQALARLRHPGIAQIYEAGTFQGEVGEQPYFAMEYIPAAKPITEYADEMDLGIEQRIQLFERVCDAVHHGHQKGIIHRDLKPDNILVDRGGNPKIIDFGVARATDADLAVTTLQTSVGQIIGTLQYMSPEQCLGDPCEVDTRADVYSLGVILYELLCHELPYDIGKQAMLEAIRVIREDAPRRPSTITRVIRGDIETITLKALEKRPDRRYDSADGLRRDLNHFLQHDPIEARPPSLTYQARMFARRHRTVVASAALIVLAITGGLIATWISWSRAADLNVRLEAANVEVIAQRDLAKGRLHQAKDLHRSLLQNTFHAVRDLNGAVDAKLQIAGEVATYFSQRREAGEANPQDLETLADAFFEIAEIRGGSARGNIGELDQSIRDLNAARSVWEELAAVDPSASQPKIKVAIMYRREALVQRHLEHMSEAISSLESAARWLEDVDETDPKFNNVERIRGLSLLDQGDIRYEMDDLPLARSGWMRGLEVLTSLADRFPENPRVQADLGQALRRVGVVEADEDPRRALELFRRSRNIFQARHDAQPTSTIALRDLGWSHYYVGWSAMLIPLREESVLALDDGWQLIVLRCSLNPNDAATRGDVAKYLASLVEIHHALDAMDLVPARTRHAALIIQPVIEANPRNIALAEVLRDVIDAGQHATVGVSAE
jgi:tetratricopeptide (TPR) repeat protein